MAIDHAAYERLLKYKIPEVEQTLTQRDTMLYALGVGLGADPMDEKQLRFVYEKNLRPCRRWRWCWLRRARG